MRLRYITKASRRYQEEKSAGTCVRCKVEQASEGKIDCAQCRQECNNRRNKRYAKAKEEGQCVTCFRNKATPGASRCASCRILAAAKNRDKPEPACNTCCGHGGEDGWCELRPYHEPYQCDGSGVLPARAGWQTS